MLQYDECSSNAACACFHMEGATGTGICAYEWLDCSDLVPCEQTTNRCLQSDHICVRHPRCHDLPVCYPTSMTDKRICPRTTRKRKKTIQSTFTLIYFIYTNVL